MKKILSVLLVVVLCFGLMTGCGGNKGEIIGNPYADYNLAEYVTLPDYDSYVPEEVGEITVTDEDIEDAVNEILASAASTKDVTKGTVEKGDSVTISFEGTLADGTSVPGMSSESTSLTLGEGGWIEGFEESIYGATIGEPVTAELRFPDPYPKNTELSGKDVTFVITVLSKTESVLPELNEDFVKEYSDKKTVEEYKAYIAEELETMKRDERLGEIKTTIFNQIREEVVISELIQERVDEEIKLFDDRYKEQAELQGITWDEYRDQTFSFSQEEYDEQLKDYGESIVRDQMIAYAMAEKEKVGVTQEEYDNLLADVLASVGLSSKEEFQQYVGVSLEEYAEMSNVKLNLVIEKALDKIYERIS